MFENVMRKLNKILDSKIKIREAIKKINFRFTDDVPLKNYHNYIIEQKQKEEEEQYKEAVEFYRIRTDNAKNFENFFDPIEMNDYVLEFKEYLETTYNITNF